MISCSLVAINRKMQALVLTACPGFVVLGGIVLRSMFVSGGI
jgi:hypothetical protein